jgi:hypothetical protein
MPTPAAHHPTGPILARSEDALVFVGHRTPTTCTVTIGGPLVPRAPLDPRLELVDHSTTGFEWGYSGSGPAQLAFAMAHYLVGEMRARRIYQQLKADLVSNLPRAGWELDADDVRAQIEQFERGAHA